MMGGGIIGFLLIAIVIWIVFQFNGKGKMNNPFSNNRMGKEPPEATVLEILKNRYAKGKINQEEYERMKKELG